MDGRNKHRANSIDWRKSLESVDAGAVFEVAIGLVSQNECNYKSGFDHDECVFAASEQEAIFHNYLSSSYCSFHPPQCV